MISPDLKFGALRLLARRNPQGCVRHVELRLAALAEEKRTDAELCLFIAELHHQLGGHAAALDEAYQAYQATPTDNVSQALAALAVHADIATSSGHPQAGTLCDIYLTYATANDADPRHLVLVRTLRAFAIYQHTDCARARAEIADLAESGPGGTAYAVMLAHGLTAMEERCKAEVQQRPTTTLPPLPGGLLQPHLEQPDPDFLAHRVQSRRHECSSAGQAGSPIQELP